MTKREKIRAELENARKKHEEWESKVQSLEDRYREAENTEIHDMVHAARLTPEQLAELLKTIGKNPRAVRSIPVEKSNEKKEVKDNE